MTRQFQSIGMPSMKQARNPEEEGSLSEETAAVASVKHTHTHTHTKEEEARNSQLRTGGSARKQKTDASERPATWQTNQSEPI